MLVFPAVEYIAAEARARFCVVPIPVVEGALCGRLIDTLYSELEVDSVDDSVPLRGVPDGCHSPCCPAFGTTSVSNLRRLLCGSPGMIHMDFRR